MIANSQISAIDFAGMSREQRVAWMASMRRRSRHLRIAMVVVGAVVAATYALVTWLQIIAVPADTNVVLGAAMLGNVSMMLWISAGPLMHPGVRVMLWSVVAVVIARLLLLQGQWFGHDVSETVFVVSIVASIIATLQVSHEVKKAIERAKTRLPTEPAPSE